MSTRGIKEIIILIVNHINRQDGYFQIVQYDTSECQILFPSFFFYFSIKEDAASFDVIKKGHLTKLLDEDISADVDSLHVQKVILTVSELMKSLKSYGEDYTSDKHKVNCFSQELLA